MPKGIKGFQKGTNHKGMEGKKHTEEWKIKMRKKNLGRKMTLKDREKMKNRHLELWKNLDYKKKMIEQHINNPPRIFKNTSIELKMEAELQKRNINYQKQVPLCKIAIVDFYLPEYRIVVQCDGDYWHNKIGAKEKDERQDKVLTFNGFNVYRFWEHEINESVKECVDKIKIC